MDYKAELIKLSRDAWRELAKADQDDPEELLETIRVALDMIDALADRE